MTGSLIAEPSVAMVLSHRVGLSTAIPYLGALIDAGAKVNLYCLGDFAELAAGLVPPEVRVVDPDDIQLSARASRRLNKLVFAFSSLDPGLNRDQRQRFAHRGGMAARVRTGTLSAIQRVPPDWVNRIVQTVGRMRRPILTEDQIWVVSFLTDPLLLAGRRGGRVVTLVDSWDHPVRRTAGYYTDAVIGWNQDIANDWGEFQGAHHCLPGVPLKLRYAADAYPLNQPGDKSFMFAVGTSSHTPVWEEAELRLAQLIAEAAEAEGWEMVLKLKPTGGQDGWFQLAERYEHVRATSAPYAATPMDYFLDDGYNATRLGELAGVRFVVNTVTTFGLDAACAGVPVLQLAGLEGAGLQGLASAQRNYHLQKYLMSRPDDLLYVTEGDVRQRMIEWLASPDERAARYSDRLRRWLVPDDGFDAAISQAASAALHDRQA